MILSGGLGAVLCAMLARRGIFIHEGADRANKRRISHVAAVAGPAQLPLPNEGGRSQLVQCGLVQP